MLDIGITIEFDSGIKTGETYFVKQELVSRNLYDKARVDHSDMPPPDSQLEDFGGELLEEVRAERQQRKDVAREHAPDPDAAYKIDSFCESMLATGECADAEVWIETNNNTLGEHSHTNSRNLIRKLKRNGAKKIHACDIDRYDNVRQNTGHLVVELPDESLVHGPCSTCRRGPTGKSQRWQTLRAYSLSLEGN